MWMAVDWIIFLLSTCHEVWKFQKSGSKPWTAWKPAWNPTEVWPFGQVVSREKRPWLNNYNVAYLSVSVLMQPNGFLSIKVPFYRLKEFKAYLCISNTQQRRRRWLRNYKEPIRWSKGNFFMEQQMQTRLSAMVLTEVLLEWMVSFCIYLYEYRRLFASRSVHLTLLCIYTI